MSGNDKLLELKKLLLEDDWKAHQELVDEIKRLNGEITEYEKLAQKVDPIIDAKIETFEKAIPETLGPAITAALEKEVSGSQDKIIDALYPIIGKLIKKFIVMEMKVLTEKIDKQLAETFSFKGLKMKLKSWFTGSKESDFIISELDPPELQEMFLIEKDSGLLEGSYSRNDTLDQDMIAGMLTAIKSFVEEAFSKKGQELEVIEYDSYKIHLYSFQQYYMAVVISGIANAQFKGELYTKVFSFMETFISVKNDNSDEELISKKIKEYFEN